MKRLFAIVALVMLTGCTSQQLAKWQEWFEQDPEAALEFANRPEIQEQLTKPTERATSSTSVWDAVAECESGQRWDYNGGSGYDGGLQFHPSSWRGYGGRDFAEFAWQASREQQIIVAERILNDAGWKAWPACSRKLGLR